MSKHQKLLKKLCIAHQLRLDRGKTPAYEKLQHMRSCVFQNNKTYSRSCVYQTLGHSVFVFVLRENTWSKHGIYTLKKDSTSYWKQKFLAVEYFHKARPQHVWENCRTFNVCFCTTCAYCDKTRRTLFEKSVRTPYWTIHFQNHKPIGETFFLLICTSLGHADFVNLRENIEPSKLPIKRKK